MINFIYSLMTDKKKGLIYAPFKFILYILSLIYGLCLVCRKFLYTLRIFRSNKVPLNVISVGNITMGGTGKTPFTIALAGIIEGELKRTVAILIRGYGWDEQALLKKSLSDVPILVGEDRTKSAHKAIKLYGSSFVIMDDGFQHWELRRNLDIVLIDSGNPFGNGCLFPRGILRESPRALKRAHIAVLTKTDKAGDIERLKSLIRSINKDIIFIEAMHKPVYLYDHKIRERREVSFLSKKDVLLVSSIGDPMYFEHTIKSLGARVTDHIVFPDHHNYTDKDLSYILDRSSRKVFDFMVTTEKDAVKFARMSFSFGKFKMMTLGIGIDIHSGRESLIDRLRGLRIC